MRVQSKFPNEINCIILRETSQELQKLPYTSYPENQVWGSYHNKLAKMTPCRSSNSTLGANKVWRDSTILATHDNIDGTDRTGRMETDSYVLVKGLFRNFFFYPREIEVDNW